MATELVVGLAFAAVLLMGASVFGAVDGRERIGFVAGVALVLLGLTFLSGPTGGILSLLGFVAVVASTIPLLRG